MRLEERSGADTGEETPAVISVAGDREEGFRRLGLLRVFNILAQSTVVVIRNKNTRGVLV